MKKIILLLITLIILTNVSYASFPVAMDFVISIDTIKPDTNKIIVKETKSEYHYRMQKEGFDIENCMCESCMAGIPLSVEFINQNKTDIHKNISKVFLVIGAIGLIMILHARYIATGFGLVFEGAILVISSIIVLLINLFIRGIKENMADYTNEYRETTKCWDEYGNEIECH